jgi:hypothetical protein
MRLIIVNLATNNSVKALRYAVLPTGGLAIAETINKGYVIIETHGIKREVVVEGFDNIVESFNAELEQWRP